MLSRKAKLKSLHMLMAIILLFGLIQPGLALAATNAETDSVEEEVIEEQTLDETESNTEELVEETTVEEITEEKPLEEAPVEDEPAEQAEAEPEVVEDAGDEAIEEVVEEPTEVNTPEAETIETEESEVQEPTEEVTAPEVETEASEETTEVAEETESEAVEEETESEIAVQALQTLDDETEFIVHEAYLSYHVVSEVYPKTTLVLNLSHEAGIGTLSLYNSSGEYQGFLRDSDVNNNHNLQAGYNELTFSTNYCPEFASGDDCLTSFPAPDGVYTIKGKVHSGDQEAEISVGPYIVKSSEPFIELDSADDGTISGVVHDDFIDWPEVDHQAYLNAEYNIYTDDSNRENVTFGSLTINADGTFSQALPELPHGYYELDVVVTDIADNTRKTSTYFTVERDGDLPTFDELVTNLSFYGNVVNGIGIIGNQTWLTLNLNFNLAERATLHGTLWDELNGEFLGTINLQDHTVWGTESQEAGEGSLPVSNYCPAGYIPNPIIIDICSEAIPNGVFSINVTADIDDEAIEGSGAAGPIIVKTKASEITFNPIDDTIDVLEITGHISDELITWSEQVNDTFAFDFRDFLDVSYTIHDEDGFYARNGDLTLENDGSFSVPLTGLTSGTYSVTVFVDDDFGNSNTSLQSEIFTFSGDPYIDFDFYLTYGTVSEWNTVRAGVPIEVRGLEPDAEVLLSIPELGFEQTMQADEYGYIFEDFRFNQSPDSGEYVVNLTYLDRTLTDTLTIVTNDDYYTNDWDWTYTRVSSSQFVYKQSEVAAGKLEVEGNFFPDFEHIDIYVNEQRYGTIVADGRGEIAFTLNENEVVAGENIVEFSHPVNTFAVTFTIVPDEQGTPPPAGEYIGKTNQKIYAGSERDEPREYDLTLITDENGNLTGLETEYFWMCPTAPAPNFGTSPFGENIPTIPLTADQPFEIAWEGEYTGNYLLVGSISSNGVATGTGYSASICGNNIFEFTAYLDGIVPEDPDPEDPDDGEPGDGEPGDGEPGDGEPGDGEPGDGEPGDGEPGDGEPGDGEPGDGEPGDGEPGDGEPGDGEPGDGEPGDGEPGDGEPGDGEPGDGEPGDGEPGDGEPGDGEPGDGEPGDGEPGDGEPGDGEPGDGEPGDGEPGDGEPGDGEPGDGEPGDGEPGDGEPGDGEPGDGEPGDGEPGDGEPGDGEPGDGEPGDGEPGDGEPGDGEPGDGEPGDGEPGDGEPGDGEPGDKPTEQEIVFDQTVDVTAGQLIEIKDSAVTIQLPDNLPEGTKLKISIVEHADAAGDVIKVDLQLSEGHEDFSSSYVITLAVDDEFSDKNIAIFHLNESNNEWEFVGGEVDRANKTISVTVNHFSTYGVFALEDEDEDAGTRDDQEEAGQAEDDDDSDAQGTGSTEDDGKKTGTSSESTATGQGGTLPQTATNMYNILLLGGILLLLGGVSFYITRRRA